jgi:hypothetical protein
LLKRAAEFFPSGKLVSRISALQVVLNPKNKTYNLAQRRGDGTLGLILVDPNNPVSYTEGSSIPRAMNTNVQIGAELKIVSAAQIRQIGRVISDIKDQGRQFKDRASHVVPITIAIAAVNEASAYASYEGERITTTGSGRTKHPSQEAAETRKRLGEQLQNTVDQLIVLRYAATNMPPYPFEWVDLPNLERAYSNLLTWVANEYES